MATWAKWEVICDTCGIVYSWAGTKPTECPNDSGHDIIDGMTPNTADQFFASIQNKIAFDKIYLNNGSDVWEVTVDGSGNLIPVKVT